MRALGSTLLHLVWMRVGLPSCYYRCQFYFIFKPNYFLALQFFNGSNSSFATTPFLNLYKAICIAQTTHKKIQSFLPSSDPQKSPHGFCCVFYLLQRDICYSMYREHHVDEFLWRYMSNPGGLSVNTIPPNVALGRAEINP